MGESSILEFQWKVPGSQPGMRGLQIWAEALREAGGGDQGVLWWDQGQTAWIKEMKKLH